MTKTTADGCLLGEAGYNPSDAQLASEERTYLTSAVIGCSIVSHSDDSALFGPCHGSQSCIEYAVLQSR
jgi:hypothetical protein